MQFTLTRALRVLADSLGLSAFRHTTAVPKAIPPSARTRRERAVHQQQGRQTEGRRQNVIASAVSAAVSTVAAQVSNALEPLEGRAMMSATYYVSPTGNDANAGTSQSAPWKSIAKVNAHTLAAGDQILFQGGKTFGGSISLKGGGTTAAPAVLGSYGLGQATISSGGSTGILAQYNVGGVTVENLTLVGNGNGGSSQYGIKFEAYTGSVLPAVTITNCDISGYYASGILIEGDSAHNAFASTTITHDNVHNNVISGIMTYSGHYQMTGVYIGYNSAHDNTGKAGVTGCGNGIELQGLEGAMVEHNVAYANGVHAVGGDGIWAYGSDHVTFQYNASYDNLTAGGVDGDGFDFDSGMSNSVMQYNYAAGNAGGGYMIDQWQNNSVQTGDVLRFNIAQDNGLKNNYGNIDIWGKDINTQVYNNTIYTTSAGSGPAIRIHNATITNLFVNGLHVDNNIFVTTGGAALTNVTAAETKGAVGLTFDGNVYYSSGAATKIGYGGTTYSSLAAFQAATGQEKVGGVAVGSSANPLLVGGGTAGMSATTGTNLASYLSAYQLQANSPVLAAGVNLKSVAGITLSGTDMYGKAISVATVTPGAATVESSTVASPTSTPTPTPTPTPVATPTPTPTKTPTPTPTPSPTTTPIVTAPTTTTPIATPTAGTVGSSKLVGWDIGAFGRAGSNSQSGTTETMTASGSDIYGTADSYRYAYTTLTGNGQIIAQVASESDANSWAKAGVMIRNATTAANAAEVSLSLTPKGIAQMITRGTAGAASTVAAQASDGGDEWVKLVRSGNTFDSYISANGTNWTLVGASTVSMNASVTIGLAVTTHDTTKLESATFKNVSIT